MEAEPPTRMEQIVDWRSAIIAGLVAGLVFLVAEVIGRVAVAGWSPWITIRYIAAIVMGTDALPPPPTFDPLIFIVAILVNFVLAVIFSMILAAIIHEWELVVGIILGALFGLAIYAINYYTFTRFFPWFFPVRNWTDVLAHVLFGAVAGGVYEALEREEFVPVYEE